MKTFEDYQANTPILGPDTEGIMFRLTDTLVVEAHRPSDEDGAWFPAREIAPMTPERQEITNALYADKVMWVHSLDAHPEGSILGWPATGDLVDSGFPYWSGIVVRDDRRHVRVLVRAIFPATMIRPRVN